MRFGQDDLRRKALLALEEAVQQCRHARPRRTLALRFALAFLWATSKADREPFDRFWRALGDPRSPWSFGAADGALLGLFRSIGVERDEEIAFRLWEAEAARRKSDPSAGG